MNEEEKRKVKEQLDLMKEFVSYLDYSYETNSATSLKSECVAVIGQAKAIIDILTN